MEGGGPSELPLRGEESGGDSVEGDDPLCVVRVSGFGRRRSVMCFGFMVAEAVHGSM